MMKSYRNWQDEMHYQREVMPIAIREWSIWNPFGGRGMGKEEGGEMDRFGKMLGFNKSWFNIFSQDSRHGGDNMITALKKIGAEIDPQVEKEMNFIQGELQKPNLPPQQMQAHQQKLNQLKQQVQQAKGEALSKLLNNPGKVSQNAPFKMAYDAMNRVKQNVNQVDRGNLDHEDVQLLTKVLTNAHKQGNIPFKDLNQLWRNVTGVMDDQGQVDPQAAQLAKGNDVHTPLHLLKTFFGIGGGIFSSPSNLEEIKAESAKILRQAYPDEFAQLFNAKFGTSPGGQPPAGQQVDQNQGGKKKGGGAGPAAAPAPAAAGQPPSGGVDQGVLDGLQQALQFQNDPQQMSAAIMAILQKLQGNKAPAAPAATTTAQKP